MTEVLDPLATADDIASSYRRYLTSTFSPRRRDLARDFELALTHKLRVTKGPYLQASAPFVPGLSTSELVDKGVLSDGWRDVSARSFPIERSLHLHQQNAIERAINGRNLVVATGTGSGKTETFLIPIVDQLLRERDAGTLAAPGVRALLLYPMNALANDQVKRLRQFLADLPDITFGRYVGETAESEREAQNAFADRFPGEPRVPNELLSRERMKDTPPHILLTNYAMLEYLLLRPEDSSLFDGPTGEHWRSIVLDEAHVYDGAQGTEVALLLRRVRDRVLRSERGRLQCFATSATLGQGTADYPDLIRFAGDLFDEPFEYEDDDSARQDIVEAVRLPLARTDATLELPQSAFSPLRQAVRSGASAAELARLAQPVTGTTLAPKPGEEAPAYLVRLLEGETHVVELQALLEKSSVDARPAAGRIFTGPTADEDLVALIDLCVVARDRPDDAPLIPARYHFFVRSLEGAFVCQHPSHRADRERLVLSRHATCTSCRLDGHDATMFELGVCRNCRAEYLTGAIVHTDGADRLETVGEFGRARAYFLLGDPLDEDDEDDTSIDDGTAGSTNKTLLCPGCSAVGEGSTVPGCSCASPPTPLRVTRVEPPKGDILRRCAACSTRTAGEVVFRFVTGTDAPVSVIATELYQHLPASTDEDLADQVGQGRKLLAFSDSRQDAAFFAPYLERTYGRAIQRRLIMQAIEELSERGTPRSQDIVDRVRLLAEEAWVMDPDAGEIANLKEVGYWLAEELLALDRRQSLEGTGSAEISLVVPRKATPPRMLLDLGLSPEESTDLLQMLLETLRATAAVSLPKDVDIRNDRFAPRNVDIAIRRNGPERSVLAWVPGSGMNRRLEILTKVFERKEITADPKEVLGQLWDGLTAAGSVWADTFESIHNTKQGDVKKLDWSRFEFRPLSADHLPYRCDTCARVWWRTVADICPSWRCGGTVHRVADAAELRDNHYASLYRELRPIGMAVQEHTAQWQAKQASKIQQQFITGEVNTLSCSTTFELGVDVGDVQAVLLRNVPPTAANYVQRAGRAGRRTDSAALVVTFAQRRSHDRSHFDNPERLVDGWVNPPRILLDNEPIGRRHAHSVAFASFERRAVDLGGSADRTVADFFVDEDGAGSAVWEDFVHWLRSGPDDLQTALDRLLPKSVVADIGVDTWAWVDALTVPNDDDPTHGWLRRAADEVTDEIGLTHEAEQQAAEAGNYKQAGYFKSVRSTLSRRNLLSFLASRNVLPKYGFPVDVVELHLHGTTEAANLDLARDLSLAITDYAPGAQVVAAKEIWVSTGVQHRSTQKLPVYDWAVCDDCGAFRQRLATEDSLEPCDVCGSEKRANGKSGKYLLPLFGFVGRHKETAGESRPIRSTSSERYFGDYADSTSSGSELVQSLSNAIAVRAMTSRQGRINIVNRGPLGRGYMICDWCGHGAPAGLPGDKTKEKAKAKDKGHPDPTRDGRVCTGPLQHRHLGHQLLTDVTEIGIDLALSDTEARSTLYALLEGVEAIGVARGDIDGTLHIVSKGEAPRLMIFDRVPGGAGHAQRIHENLLPVFRQALARVVSCECGRDSSCYGCLRNYGNQLYHDELQRGLAEDVLRAILNGAADDSARIVDHADDEIHDLARPAVAAAIAAGFDDYIVGYELDADEHWPVEVAWPEQRVALVVDEQAERDASLAATGWQVVDARKESGPEVARALARQS